MSAPSLLLRRTLLHTPRFRPTLATPKFPQPIISNRLFAMSAPDATDGGVHNLANKAAWDDALTKDGLLVLDCFATWCGPCKVIAPQIVKYSQKYTDVKFYKVDVDEVPDVAQELGIRAMPTFLFFKGGEKVAEVVGANPKAIEAAIESHRVAKE